MTNNNNISMAGRANVPNLRTALTDKNRGVWRDFVDTYHAYEMAYGEDELNVEVCIDEGVLWSIVRLLLRRGMKTTLEEMTKMTMRKLNEMVEKIWAETSIEDVYAGITQRRMAKTTAATHFDDCQKFVNDMTFFLNDQAMKFDDVQKKAIVAHVVEGTRPPLFRERVKRRHDGSSNVFELFNTIILQSSEEEEIMRRAEEIKSGFSNNKKDQDKKKSANGAYGFQKTVEDTPKKDADDTAGVMTRSQYNNKTDKFCTSCEKRGHVSMHCWKELLCEECGKTGHPTARCYHRAGTAKALKELNEMERLLNEDEAAEDNGPDGWFRPGEF